VTGQTEAAAAKAGEQVAALRALSEGALREAGELFRALDAQGKSVAGSTREHGRALAEVALALEQIEQRVGVALANRRDGLEEVLDAIAGRTDDVEAITRSFTAMVDDSLRMAESRARQIGNVLAESAQSTSQAIGEQFDIIRVTTGKERERTAAALRAADEQAMSEAWRSAVCRHRPVPRGGTGDARADRHGAWRTGGHPRRTAPRRPRAAA